MSGYNILIFVGLLQSLGSLFLRRRRTWLFVIAGIVLYCIFAVPPRPDGVRAANMPTRGGWSGTWMQNWDADNRVASMSGSGGASVM